jgi:hypothetical protein
MKWHWAICEKKEVIAVKVERKQKLKSTQYIRSSLKRVPLFLAL